ncbi:hypothetical protein Vafri_2591, partial [Volvox africanus]
YVNIWVCKLKRCPPLCYEEFSIFNPFYFIRILLEMNLRLSGHPNLRFQTHVPGRKIVSNGPQIRVSAALSTATANMNTISNEFGLVAGVVVASWMVHHGYMAVKVIQARKKYNVSYPALYATAEECPNPEHRKAFNCVQRGHQNSLENQPMFLALLFTAGLKHPITAAAAGVIYLVGRVMYMQGYSTGVPDKRMRGSIGYVGLFTLIGIACKWGVQSALAVLQK